MPNPAPRTIPANARQYFYFACLLSYTIKIHEVNYMYLCQWLT